MIPNIYFKIGQPSTGKSYGFQEKNLKKAHFKDTEKIVYKKIPVSGGIGNEYKGLQNTDLALSYDVVNKTLKFGEFLQTLMKATSHPAIPHIVFLDDFHNQDISSLLSEYTPLFKAQQKVDLKDNEQIKDAPDLEIFQLEEFEKVEDFIQKWNEFIKSLGVHYESITNRISGEDLLLVYPANFYLLGGANFNEKTISIFADWADRAAIEYVNPIENMDILKDRSDFIQCAKSLNNNLKNILEDSFIFDYEKYCFGIWKVQDENQEIIKDEAKQQKIIKFFFSMIKNSLIYNNKNSEINEIGWKLIQSMKDDDFFKNNFKEINFDLEFDEEDKEVFKILHQFGIYEG